MKLESCNLMPELTKAFTEMGITTPTEIQEKTIPSALEGKDVIGIAKTGSGKTVAFSIPVLQRIVPRGGLQAIILAPTRELAMQISKEMHKFSKHMQVKIATVYGGVSLQPQQHQLTRSEICIATPGRLLDHLERGNIDVSKNTIFVLDEADKMVEMGFVEDVTRILSAMPTKQQMLLFCATMSDDISRIASKYMHHPLKVIAEEHVHEDYLQQYYYNVDKSQKFSLLVHLLKKEKPARAIIFCSKVRTSELVAQNLQRYGFKVGLLHGKLRQNKREFIMHQFDKGSPPLLIASPVAARGLDIKEVTHVFNFDLAQNPQEYVHRVGRTARAGQTGKAITLLSHQDHDAFRSILQKYPINVVEMPQEQFEKLQFDPSLKRGGDSDREGGFRGGRRDGNRGFGRGERRFGDRRESGDGFREKRGGFGRDSPESFRKEAFKQGGFKPRSEGPRSSGFRSERRSEGHRGGGYSERKEGGDGFKREGRGGFGRSRGPRKFGDR